MDITDDETLPSDGDAGFDSEEADLAGLPENNVYFENIKVANIFELFTVESQIRLSSFLRKKITIKLDSMNACAFHEIEHDNTKLLSLNFQLLPEDTVGLVALDFIFLDCIINLLYGGKVTDSKASMRGLGKSGIKIAQKIADIFLTVLQESLMQHLKLNVKLSTTSSLLSSVFMQEQSEQCYIIFFHANIDSVICHFKIVMPANTFINADSNVELNSEVESQNNNEEMPDDQPIFDQKARNELIDSSIMLTVNLPPIALKLKNVVNLKAGDVIPIGDPMMVYIALNKKNIFKASAGQSNLRRAVKIIDKM